jgi:hypothetical protein
MNNGDILMTNLSVRQMRLKQISKQIRKCPMNCCHDFPGLGTAFNVCPPVAVLVEISDQAFLAW